MFQFILTVTSVLALLALLHWELNYHPIVQLKRRRVR
jgi:hypothetical protein